MTLKTISFKPIAAVELSADEISVLMKCSARHYDGVCKDASAPGGFLFGVRNYAELAPGRTHHLTWRELDTLAKIVEVCHFLPDEESQVAFGIGLTIRRIFAKLEEATPDAMEADVS